MSQINHDAIQLQPLKQIPTLIDLANLLAWLSDCRETYMLERSLDSLKQVLLPWLHAESGEQFALGLSISKKLPDIRPIWTFYKVLEPEPQVEWAYATHDISLVHNMLLCFFPDENYARAENISYASLPQTASQASRQNVRNTSGEKQAPFLQGSIQKLQLDCVLQSLASSRITGKLIVSSQEKTGLIFFEDGTPIHCLLEGEEGHDAMLQLLTWQGGDFDVFSDELAPKRSITRRMESLLMEGAALIDYANALEEAGVTEQTVLEKVAMCSGEYAERMKDAPPVEEDLLASIAMLLDNPSSIEEIAARLGLTRPNWLPVLYGIIKTGVVRISPIQETARARHQNAVQLCASEIGADGILDGETGLYTFAAFRLFLQLELARCHAHSGNVSIIVLSVSPQNEKLTEVANYSNCVRSIELLCRPADLLCLVESSGIGLILPDTSRAGAEVVARRMKEQWIRSTNGKDGDSAVAVNIGVASFPADANSLDELLIAASRDIDARLEVLG